MVSTFLTTQVYNFSVPASQEHSTSQANIVSPLSHGFPSKSSLEECSDIAAAETNETQPLIGSTGIPTSSALLSPQSIPSSTRGTDSGSRYGSTGATTTPGSAINTPDADIQSKQAPASSGSGPSSTAPIANTPITTTIPTLNIPNAHHWREGNLPVYSKCAVCRKTCWSAECLTGFRCEWCGTTVIASH